MFTVDQNVKTDQFREKNFVKVFFSMNNHEVATPEMTLEEARSYVIFCGEPGAKISAFIGIYLLQSGRRLFYAHSANPFSPAEMGSVEDEALCFVEGLGALVDQIDIVKLSAEEKRRWIDGQDIFSLEAGERKYLDAVSSQPAEAEAEQTEQEAMQPSPEVLFEDLSPQSPAVRPEPQPASAPLIQLAPSAPRMQPVQAVPETLPAAQADQAPRTVAPALHEPPLPTEEEQTAPVEESAQQPLPSAAVEAEMEYEVQLVQSPAAGSETMVAPTSRPASKEAAPDEDPLSAPEGMRSERADRDPGALAAPPTASAMGRRDIGQRTTKDEIDKASKPSIKKGAEEYTGVVRRDREALARLLSSF